MVVSESEEVAYKNRNELSESLFLFGVFKLPSQSKQKIREGEQGKERSKWSFIRIATCKGLQTEKFITYYLKHETIFM